MEKDYTLHVFVIGVIAFAMFCSIMDYNYPPKGDREINVKYQDRLEMTQ